MESSPKDETTETLKHTRGLSIAFARGLGYANTKMYSLRLLQPFGVDLFCTGKKFLVFNLVSRNLKIKYRRSIFGFFWTILNPLATAMVFYLVFKVFLKVAIPNYLVFILCGIFPWTFFSGTLLENMESLVGNQGLLSKIPIPLHIFPYVGSVTNLVTLFLSLPILMGAAIFTGVPLGPSVVLLPLLFFALFLLAYSFSMILSIAFVYFRDLRHIMGILMQIWFYGTPVIYDESMVPENFKWLLYANPVALIFTELRHILVHGEWPDPARLASVAAWTLGVLTVGLLVQKNFSESLVEQL